MREWAGGVFAAVLAGCSAQIEGRVVQRDSAGVMLVESHAPAVPDRLTISAGGWLDIGGQSDSNPKTEFIGPVSAVRMSNGHIVAAGWAATELQVFDSSGRWVQSIGTRGSGPREFEALGSVYLSSAGDLVTYEPGSRRIQFFDSAGAFHRLTSLIASPDEGTPGVVGALLGGALLVRTNAAIDSGGGEPLIPNRHRYYRYDPMGQHYDFLLQVEGPIYLRHPANPQHRIGILPFAPGREVAPFGNSVMTLTKSGFGVDILDSTGSLSRSFRRRVGNVPLSLEERRVGAEEATTGMEPALAKAVEEVIVGSDLPHIRPAAVRLAPTTDGLVLVQHFESPGRPSRLFSVFGPAGHWVQDLELPIPFYLIQAGRTFVLGTYEDSSGFHHIVHVPLSIRF